MQREDIWLEGIVLHSSDIHQLRSFYENLLGVQFKEEKHGDGPKHYACSLENGFLMELYPLKARVLPPDPSLIFNVHNLETTLERMKLPPEKIVALDYGARIADPDGRKIILYKIK